MNFTLSKEQELLRDGLSKFLTARYDLSRSRATAKTGSGWQPEVWQAFADELGILGAAFSEASGGSGGGPIEIMVIAQALGHALVIEPYVGTVVVSGGLLQRAGTPTTAAVLKKIIDGSAIVALAAAEPNAGDRWEEASTTAERDGGGWVLNGAKIVVLDAPLATHLLITARASDEGNDADGISLFLVDLSAVNTGISSHEYRTIDDRRAADITIENLRLPDTALVGPAGRAGPSLSQAHDEATAAICAEAVGAMSKMLTDTVAYSKQRTQFNQPISNFQVLQHRMVDMYMELQQATSAVYLAFLNLEEDQATRARAVSAAKATIGRAARFISQNAVQLHGGMGSTEELAIGYYFKRLTAIQHEFGSTDHHVARYAALTRSSVGA